METCTILRWDKRRWPMLLSLAMTLALAAPLSAQNNIPQSSPNMQQGDSDTTRWQLSRMDQFLDAHPEIAEQLLRDPSLINNREFVEKHPALQDFLQQHPGVREEFSENPQAFMHREERYDRREDQSRGRFGESDTTRWQIARTDEFLDNHPEIAEQLRRDPSLINNQEFVQKHPALQEFLQQHPGVREEFTENPQAFMRAENRYDRREDQFQRGFGDRDTTRWQVARTDQFLDSHPEIAEQLQRDPSLINNQQFVQKHPALQEFLQQHPGVREEFTENPQGFMHREQRYDQWEARNGQIVNDRMTDREQAAGFAQFLGGHSLMAQQLAKDPTLVNNKEYLASHGELRDYLKTHPGAQQELTQNPQAFMSAVQQSGSTATTGKVAAPKPKGN